MHWLFICNLATDKKALATFTAKSKLFASIFRHFANAPDVSGNATKNIVIKIGIGIFYLLIILVILTTCCLIWLFISIKKKSKIGIIIPILFFLFVGFLFSLNYIDENTISNEDVKNDLQVINLNLKDTFKILENDVSGMPERYQKQKLKFPILTNKT
ncbi:hypothetical protein OBK08_01415 [Empedobacter falsenii]